MPDSVRQVKYFSIFVSDKPGKAFQVLSTLVSANVNLLACSGVPSGRRARISVVPENTAPFRRVVKKAGLAFAPEKTGFLIQGEDRAGALAGHLRALGEHDINVTGIDALSAGKGRWGAIIWVDAAAVRKAGNLLRSGAGAAPGTRKRQRNKA